MSIAVSPAIRPKTFLYETALADVQGRSASLTAAGKPAIEINAPPEFKGLPGFWTPEDLFVASVESCLMLTVVGIAEKAGLAIVSYSSTADGLLEWRDASYEFTRVVVRPVITVSSSAAAAAMRAVVEKAERTCLVANSVRSTVLVEPTIVIVTANVG
jgi:organic hydroperoxide reductase OsmC/OhrA